MNSVRIPNACGVLFWGGMKYGKINIETNSSKGNSYDRTGEEDGTCACGHHGAVSVSVAGIPVLPVETH